ncbi:MAG: MarR family transcriptional regulator [Deltaproteobacteria bacterium]|nr:MarR family transcriptional regulator [Deltaproteobacteria bacterium]
MPPYGTSAPFTGESGKPAIPEHEALAVEAVGDVIEFWGFKRNQGRIWALLYLRAAALTAAEIQSELDLSKGAVSMLLNELMRWGVVIRTRDRARGVLCYGAETNLMRMIGRVLREREVGMLTKVRNSLERSEALARREKADDGVIERIARMRRLSSMFEQSVNLFLETAKIDVGPALTLLDLAKSLNQGVRAKIRGARSE